MDLAKAFDKVPHHRLLEKIDKHGITGKVLNWLNEWLKGRSLYKGTFVYWEGGYERCTTRISILLGPVLFLMFIKSSGHIDLHIKVCWWYKMFGVVNNVVDRYIIQQDLHLKSGKCLSMLQSVWCYILVGVTISYDMGNKQLETVSEERDLSVYISNNLKPVRQCVCQGE